MRNRSAILMLLLAIGVCAAALVHSHYWPTVRATGRARILRNMGDVETVDALTLSDAHGARLRFERTAGAWWMTAPFRMKAKAGTVERLLDGTAFSAPTGVLSEKDLLALGRTPRDFGLAPAQLAITLVRQGQVAGALALGAYSPAGDERYVCTAEGRGVMTVPAAAFATASVDPEVFRPTGLESLPAGMVAAIEVRVANRPFVKLVRAGASWRLSQPAEAPANVQTVQQFLGQLAHVRVQKWIWPVADRPRPALETFGLGEENAGSVTVTDGGEHVCRIVFGHAAESNTVYALVNNGEAVASIDAAAWKLCSGGSDVFRDRRIFPFAAGAIRRLTIAGENENALLACGTNDHWRFEAPVRVETDAQQMADFMDRLLALTEEDIGEDGPAYIISAQDERAGAQPVRVAIPAARLGGGDLLARLRTKRIVSFDPAQVVNFSITPAAGDVRRFSHQAAARWMMKHTVASEAPGAANAEKEIVREQDGQKVARFLQSLGQVDAVSVESPRVTSADFKLYGFEKPAFAFTVELADGARKTLLLGAAASGGGRFATAGGTDAIFIVSRKTVADLTALLME